MIRKEVKQKSIEKELRRSGAVGKVTAITMFSRFLGLFREQTRAFFLGTGAASEAFTAAFMLPNLLRRFLSEGVMSAAIVPVLTEYQSDRAKKEVKEFVSAVLGAQLLLLVVILSAAILTAPYYVPLLFPRFPIDLTVLLTMMMFPYIGFVSLAALFQSILNCHGRFSLAAFCPVALNVIIIGGTWSWWAVRGEGISQGQAAQVMAGAVLAGGCAQAVMLIPTLLKLDYSLAPKLLFGHPGLRRVIRLIIPVMIGGGIHQINVMVSLVLAGRFKGAAPALSYSNRLIELALGVFVISVLTVSLPGLARLWREEKKRYFNQSSFALQLILLVSIPSAAALFFMREEIIQVLFNFGAFNRDDSLHLTAGALCFHAASVPFIAGCRFFSQAFYAARDSRTPLKIGGAIAVANITFCFALIFAMGYQGIALAMTLSMGFGLALYFVAWYSKNGSGTLPGVAIFTIRTLIAAALMWLFHLGWTRYVIAFPGSDAPHLFKALHLAGAVIADGAAYLASLRLLGVRDLKEFMGVLIRRRKG